MKQRTTEKTKKGKIYIYIYMNEINAQHPSYINPRCQKSCLGPDFSDCKLTARLNPYYTNLCLRTTTSFTNQYMCYMEKPFHIQK